MAWRSLASGAAAGVKPVVAVVNGTPGLSISTADGFADMAASAAYAIASAATQIITTQSGISGSIGVVMLHADYSAAIANRGIKPTFIHAGARKIDGNAYQPLTDDVKAELSAEINRFYDLFRRDSFRCRPLRRRPHSVLFWGGRGCFFGRPPLGRDDFKSALKPFRSLLTVIAATFNAFPIACIVHSRSPYRYCAMRLRSSAVMALKPTFDAIAIFKRSNSKRTVGAPPSAGE